jgi:hypothetical protein
MARRKPFEDEGSTAARAPALLGNSASLFADSDPAARFQRQTFPFSGATYPEFPSHGVWRQFR